MRPGWTSRSSASTGRSRISSTPRCSSPPSSRRASRSTRRCARAASARRRRRPLGRRVLGARCPPGRCRHAMRSRSSVSAAIAMAEAAMEQPGLDGRDSRPRRRGGRGAVPQDRERLAGELQLPRPARHLRRDAVGRRGLRRGDARGRTARRSSSASRARSTRRSSRAPPSGCARRSRGCISARARPRSCRR